ncbi:PAS domain-containing protein, partial [Acinetobacter baumannii]
MLANDAFTRECGYAEADLVGKGADEIGLWVDTPAGKALEQQLHREGSARNLGMKLRTKEGGVLDCLVSAEAM